MGLRRGTDSVIKYLIGSTFLTVQEQKYIRADWYSLMLTKPILACTHHFLEPLAIIFKLAIFYKKKKKKSLYVNVFTLILPKCAINSCNWQPASKLHARVTIIRAPIDIEWREWRNRRMIIVVFSPHVIALEQSSLTPRLYTWDETLLTSCRLFIWCKPLLGRRQLPFHSSKDAGDFFRKKKISKTLHLIFFNEFGIE